MAIPVIDLFAGPGGLGEGFSSLTDTNGNQRFKIALSIEKDIYAHETLTLRSFFRQFKKGEVPQAYYDFLNKKITKAQLFQLYPNQANEAKDEAWLCELGDSKTATLKTEIDNRIEKALNKSKDWLLIGGPPCQAYSIVGRSRRQQVVLDEAKDERVGLYKQYLRIIAVHNPAVFVMENVKGLLSAKTAHSSVFSMILKDLKDPVTAYKAEFGSNSKTLNCPGYKIYSLSTEPAFNDVFGEPQYQYRDYLIKAEDYGIPQTRHRVILLGVRNDIKTTPGILGIQDEVAISKVIDDLPRLRSGLSKSKDKSGESWKEIVFQTASRKLNAGIDKEVEEVMHDALTKVKLPHAGVGSDFIKDNDVPIKHEAEWFLDSKIGGICNHTSRGHMESDIHRYFFAACYAKAHKKSPKLENFPPLLGPAHENFTNPKSKKEDQKFADRFRVQLKNKPAKTITSHISKDGHYYIHYDPTQCRSFTVREAARIQTFPDNYFFCGNRTQQFHQVGNAVPPLLAKQIAQVVKDIF